MTQITEQKPLQTELTRIVLSGGAGLLLFAGLLCALTTVNAALLFLTAAVALWLLGWQQTRKRLPLNRANPSAPLYPTLGWANRMTLGRGWLIAVTGGFLLIPGVLITHPVLLWTAAALYSIAAILDRADGFVARRSKQTSLLGGELDTVFDALGLLVAPLLALQHGKIHAAYLLVSVAYYLFVIGIRIRQQHNKPVYPLPPSPLRRTLAGFQMGYVAVVLWPPFQAQITVLAGFGFMVPLLTGFWVDWLLVSGRLRPQAHGTGNRFRQLHQLTQRWLLPAMRVAVVLSAYLIFVRPAMTLTPAEIVVAALIALAVLLMALGLAGRAGAVLLLMLLAWTVPAPIDSGPLLVCLFATVAILLLGCGRFSLWQADDDWVNRQDGA
ncbi:CDP-alcohol phosphatidyltransferase family protein [Pseudohongiella sp.]|uniref:CDP-alcohol phosphatidyltransferase n=1 Tax=marine sediment metagenome TaxID=412755 RepID=A0A0F9YH25_9ZZZZ|nr:CDP-alcohol phosphatidyltransferase family protein [Pseudohongiella sp.]HDZ09205.1 CDP-alcohol phosphatidyltransferase family protein [Pseudohongiella sp.]HEA63367.1 CDP-alcohol phosphatidyltransferase family protein [Pseudohongiella sp.]